MIIVQNMLQTIYMRLFQNYTFLLWKKWLSLVIHLNKVYNQLVHAKMSNNSKGCYGLQPILDM